ncbi:hypothetical protein PHLH8_20700 [Pseudomonas sp. Pc102]|nr:hypothetical protein PHLH8_20700 [Pseudomonas sp. Pc102]
MSIRAPKDYFDFVIGRIAWAGGSYWRYIPFKDGSRWIRIGLGCYWRTSP